MPSFVKHYADKDRCRITRNAQRKRYYNQFSNYKPKSWTDKEEKLLFNNNMTDRELSVKLERSVQSLQVHRCKIKKGGMTY